MFLEAFNMRTEHGVTFDAAAFRMQGLEVEALPDPETPDEWILVLAHGPDGTWHRPSHPDDRFTDLDFGHPSAPTPHFAQVPLVAPAGILQSRPRGVTPAGPWVAEQTYPSVSDACTAMHAAQNANPDRQYQVVEDSRI